MEILGLYDKKGNYLNEVIDRKNKLTIPKDKYYKQVIVFIINDKEQYLIQKASHQKGEMYETLGGHVKDKYDSKETIIEELKEELSIDVMVQDITFFKKYIYNKSIQEVYYIRKNFDIKVLKYKEDEVSLAKWLSISEVKNLIKNNKMRKKNVIHFLN